MRLVESLGGEPVTLRAEDGAVETVRYARKRNVTKIVVGKPTHPRWRDVAQAVVPRQPRPTEPRDRRLRHLGRCPRRRRRPARRCPRRRPRMATRSGTPQGRRRCSPRRSRRGFSSGASSSPTSSWCSCSASSSSRCASGTARRSSPRSSASLAFDFFFVPPYFSFAVTDLSHIVTFAVMFLVAVVISGLTKRIRDQADSARGRERRTASLYAVSRELGAATARPALLAGCGASRAARCSTSRSRSCCRGAGTSSRSSTPTRARSRRATRISASPTGYGTTSGRRARERTRSRSARALFVPLIGSRGRVGVLALFPSPDSRLDDPDERQLLDTFAGLIGSALERTQLADEARRASLRIETEQLRNALLSSVSHDLRTPLAVVTGATSALLEDDVPKDEAVRRQLLMTVHEEALRLNRLVRNLLDMTRLEAGALKVQKELQPLEEVVGSALDRMEDRLRGRRGEDVRSPPTCRSCRSTRSSSSRCSSTCSRTRRSTPRRARPIDVGRSRATTRGRGRGGRSRPGRRQAGRRASLRQVLSRARGRGRGRRAWGSRSAAAS